MSADDFWTVTLVALGFLVLISTVYELVAIFTGHRERTLTFWIRTKLGIEDNLPSHAITETIFFAICTFLIFVLLWLGPHISWGWWGGAP